LRVHVGGQGELDQDAVDAGVLVQGVDAGQQIGFTEVGLVLFKDGMQTTVLTGFDLVAHINVAGRVVTHQNDSQAGGDATGFEGGGALRYFAAQLA